jgi:hypothetical protein
MKDLGCSVGYFKKPLLYVLSGTQTLCLVKLIMTDGDSQEMAQVDCAIATFLIKAV